MKKIILLLVLSLMFSCRAVKKEWVTTNFTSKTETQNLKSEVLKSIETSAKNTKESLTAKINEIYKSSNTTTETISGSEFSFEGEIQADSTEKSIVIGDTKITTKGATVKFNSSSYKKESFIDSQEYIDISYMIQAEKEKNETLTKEINSLRNEFQQFKSETESKEATKTKQIKKIGLPLFIGLLLLIAIIIFILLKIRKINPLS